MSHLTSLVPALVGWALAAFAPTSSLPGPEQWPAWRGPLATGEAPAGDPPLRWNAHENVKWKTAIPGRGSATPIVWGEKVFVLTAIDTGRQAATADLPKPEAGLEKKTQPPTTYYQFVVICLDRATGQVRWQRVATEQVPHEGHHPTHSYAAASPVTDGKHLFVSFGSRGIYCYDLDGNLKWQRDLGRLQTRYGWGEGASPALHGDTLIVNWDQEVNSFITALDAHTGQTRWRVPRNEPTSWATPLVIADHGPAQVVVNGTNRVRSYDLATGRVRWECGGQTLNAIPSPVTRDGMVYCMSGYRGSMAWALPLDVTGDVTGTEKLLWRHEHGTPYVPSPLLYKDRLYFTQGNDTAWTSLDIRTGKPVLDRVRLPAVRSFYGSPVAAAGRIYVTDREGTTLVLRAGDRLEVLATNRLDDPIDASQVVCGKSLFLRGEKYLYCLEVR